MKKLVSILLALALILSLSVTAFATTVTVSDSRDFDGHKLLNLTTSLKCEHTEGQSHTTDCYNYAYTVNETYRTILQTETFQNYNSWTEGTQPESANNVTDAQILKYLESLGSDSDGEYGTLRPAADRIYRAIKDANIQAVADISNIEQGYWLFVDVSTDKDTNSLVVVDTAGQDSLTITPKVGLPTIEKKVKDIIDSSDAIIDDNAWQNSADHDIGDTVPFKLTATLPENLAGYNTYKIVFHDTLSAGLTLNAESIKVLMYANKDTAEADVDTKNIANGDGATNVTTHFTSSTGNTFTVSCDNVKGITGVTKDTVFVVYYEATLNFTADIGLPGNPNEAYLEFSNNPYTDGTGNTEKDEVIVYTYQLTINKTDADKKPLAGAGFTLYKKNSSGHFVAVGDELGGKDSTLTTFEWNGLDDGDYKLEESTVPAGYNKMEDKLFTITADHEADTKSLSAGDFATGVFDTGIIEQSIENKTGTVLPETGAKGTLMLITISTMFVMVATVFMVTRKKMSIYED